VIRLRVEKIREYMDQKHLSQNALARRADMDVKTLQRLFREPTAEFSSYTLGKLAAALGVPAAELIEDVPDE
jgi:transcriptional regulator with XRE-family HTH domain